MKDNNTDNLNKIRWIAIGSLVTAVVSIPITRFITEPFAPRPALQVGGLVTGHKYPWTMLPGADISFDIENTGELTANDVSIAVSFANNPNNRRGIFDERVVFDTVVVDRFCSSRKADSFIFWCQHIQPHSSRHFKLQVRNEGRPAELMQIEILSSDYSLKKIYRMCDEDAAVAGDFGKGGEMSLMRRSSGKLQGFTPSHYYIEEVKEANEALYDISHESQKDNECRP